MDTAVVTEPRPRLDTSTRLAFERTYLAHERTQMAWVRTSLALISFGFGIAKFYQYLQETQGDQAPVLGPRAVGMTMIGLGLGAIVTAGVQHRRAMARLHGECPDLPRSAAGAVAAVIAVLGLAAFVVALS